MRAEGWCGWGIAVGGWLLCGGRWVGCSLGWVSRERVQEGLVRTTARRWKITGKLRGCLLVEGRGKVSAEGRARRDGWMDDRGKIYFRRCDAMHNEGRKGGELKQAGRCSTSARPCSCQRYLSAFFDRQMPWHEQSCKGDSRDAIIQQARG